MTRRLPALRPADLDAAQQALRATLAEPPGRVEVAPDGSLHGPFDAMLQSPRTGVALQALGGVLRYDGVIPGRARELVILMVAAHLGSAFEWHSHVGVAARLGIEAPLLEAIRTRAPVVPEDPSERAITDAAGELLSTGDVTDASWARVVDQLGAPAAVELVTLVGYYTLLAAHLRVLRIPLPDDAAPIEFGPVDLGAVSEA